MSESVPSESIRVFLLIENRLLREALVRLLRKRPDLTIVGESGQTDLTIQDILETNCDVLVIGSFQSNWLPPGFTLDRKSTRLNSSHQIISYAVFCLKKKK